MTNLNPGVYKLNFQNATRLVSVKLVSIVSISCSSKILLFSNTQVHIKGKVTRLMQNFPVRPTHRRAFLQRWNMSRYFIFSPTRTEFIL